MPGTCILPVLKYLCPRKLRKIPTSPNTTASRNQNQPIEIPLSMSNSSFINLTYHHHSPSPALVLNTRTYSILTFWDSRVNILEVKVLLKPNFLNINSRHSIRHPISKSIIFLVHHGMLPFLISHICAILLSRGKRHCTKHKRCHILLY